MAKMRIKCSGCKKKISVDEAFSGGMCRCPYCKAIVKVPEKPGTVSISASIGKGSARPDRPGRPDAPGRPSSPTGRAAPEKATKVKVLSPDEIPMADPVKVQGVVTLVLVLCLVLMGGVGGYIIWQMMNKPDERQKSWEQLAEEGKLKVDISNPFLVGKTPSVAGNIPVASPVIFLLDCGGSMEEPLGYATKMVRISIRSLGENFKFNIFMLRDGGNKWMTDGMEFANPTGVEKAKDTRDLIPSGRTELVAGIKEALEKKPKTLVFFGKKALEASDIREISSTAKSYGTKIVAICFNNESEVIEGYKQISEQTGGSSKAFNMAELGSYNSNPDAFE